MSTVWERAQSATQPWGGYIRPSWLQKTSLEDGMVLHEKENIHGSIVGMVVDYLTRFSLGGDTYEAFRISIEGAERAEKVTGKKMKRIAKKLLSGIKGIDQKSILNACKLVSFDVWKRNPINAILAEKDYNDINPDDETVENIQTLVRRSLTFFQAYGPVIATGFTFEPENADEREYDKMLSSGKGTFGGYTATVSSGDGDFLTSDTLWDFKVSKSNPTSVQTLQLLMYWIMGKHSGRVLFRDISKIAIFNPRKNMIYWYDMRDVPIETIEVVEKEIICYH